MPRKLPRLIRLLTRRDEAIAGDLMEEYATGGRSRWWLWKQALSTMIPVVELPKEGKMFSSYWNDIRFAARTLTKNPGFAAIAIATIALGIGVNTGIFTILDSVALKQLPTPGADRLVSVYQDIRGKLPRGIHESASFFSTAEYEKYRDQNHVFAGLAAYETLLQATVAGDEPKQIWGQLTSCNYFDVLEQPPALGRAFLAEDCRAPRSGAAVVISDSFWRSTFGADPAIVGRIATLNGHPMTIVGVAKPGFNGTESIAATFWAPFTMQSALEPHDLYGKTNMSWLAVIGRVKTGVARETVRADLSIIAARIDADQPGRTTALSVLPATLLGMPEERQIVNTVGGLILAAVGMVLLIACANVANLLLARAAGRQHEIAIRLSIGATRWRLIRQLLTESLMIAIIGGILGSILALSTFAAAVRFAIAHLPREMPELAFNISPDWRVLAYSFALTMITGIVCGLAPALRSSRPALSRALNQKSAGGFLRHSLVGLQVATCMVLLIASGLLLHGLWVAQTLDPGFSMKNISTVSFDLQTLGYNEQRAAAFQRELMDRAASTAGVESVAQAMNAPLNNNHNGSGFTPSGQTQELGAEFNYVSPEFFKMLEIPIVRGRNFTSAESWSGAPMAVVTESTARRWWPGEDPVGKTITWDINPPSLTVLQVVGVAKDAQVSHIGRSDETYVYLSYGLNRQLHMRLLVRGARSSPGAIRQAVRALEPGLVVDIAPLEDGLEFWRSLSRVSATLAGSLGVLALVLASIGIYGVVSFAVSRRVREIGIRMALGADGGTVKKMILRQALRPVFIGALVGIAGSAAISQILSSMLFGLSAYDPVAFVCVPILLLTIAMLASYAPARRATKVDPMIALRYE
jgi:macrolide transport system ATP-binding/permease protein